jgi:hypothetical protein
MADKKQMASCFPEAIFRNSLGGKALAGKES